MCPAYAYLAAKVRGRLVKEMSGVMRSRRGSTATEDGQSSEEEQGGADLGAQLAALADAVRPILSGCKYLAAAPRPLRAPRAGSRYQFTIRAATARP